MNRYKLIIEPAIKPEQRHKIEKILEIIGYKVTGGGTKVDLIAGEHPQCDISFEEVE